MFIYYIHKRGVFKVVTLRVIQAEYPWVYSHSKIRFLETLTSVTITIVI
jgi:hypothetical protein